MANQKTAEEELQILVKSIDEVMHEIGIFPSREVVAERLLPLKMRKEELRKIIFAEKMKKPEFAENYNRVPDYTTMD
jgi:hypothetical protein